MTRGIVNIHTAIPAPAAPAVITPAVINPAIITGADRIEPRYAALDVIVTGLSSDAHTWNLVYLQLLLEELGCRVTNLGACTPDEVIIDECVSQHTDLLVIGSLNGHGRQDGIRLIRALRQAPALASTPVVIGGKLDVTGGANGETAARLLAAGYDAVFEAGSAVTGEAAGGLLSFRSYLSALASRADAVAQVGAG